MIMIKITKRHGPQKIISAYFDCDNSQAKYLIANANY